MEHAMTRTARAFVDELTNIANHHGEIMRGMTEKAATDHVKSVIADNDIVFGIWEDESEANGVGVLVIKGDRELQACTASDQCIPSRISAVPCTEHDQAVAAKETLGDGDLKLH
jgi:hypothetical protein